MVCGATACGAIRVAVARVTPTVGSDVFEGNGVCVRVSVGAGVALGARVEVGAAVGGCCTTTVICGNVVGCMIGNGVAVCVGAAVALGANETCTCGVVVTGARFTAPQPPSTSATTAPTKTLFKNSIVNLSMAQCLKIV